jgi:hypothetical protein
MFDRFRVKKSSTGIYKVNKIATEYEQVKEGIHEKN